MNKLAILLDSFSGYSKNELNDKGIHMVSQTIIVDGQAYKEGQDITEKNISEIIKDGSEIKSSMPAIGVVIESLKELSKKNEHVIYITMNKGMSSTFSTGYAAAKEFKNVTVINGGTLITSMLVEVANIAFNLLKEGKTNEEIIKRVVKIADNSETYIVIKDTSHILKSGRIGTAKKLIMEKIKLIPRLKITKDGITSAGTKRNFKKTINSTIMKIIESIGEQHKNRYSFHIASTGSKETDEAIREALTTLGVEDIRIKHVPAATFGYTGSGSYGLGAMLKK